MTSGGTDRSITDAPPRTRRQHGRLRRRPASVPDHQRDCSRQDQRAAAENHRVAARSATSAATGRRYLSDVPKSSRTARPSHAAYCAATDDRARAGAARPRRRGIPPMSAKWSPGASA